MCDRPPLTNAHLGNTFSDVKYTLHCASQQVLDKCVDILLAVGFRVGKRETTGMMHTFMFPPRAFMREGTFQYVLVIKPDGNDQRVAYATVQGVHVGFRTTPAHMEEIRRRTCTLTEVVVVKKPDEDSLFLQLPCGEFIEIAGRPRPFLSLKNAARALVTVGASYVIWMA